MPPRYAYWTILIDDKPTAFRARERDELLPTLHQLRRKNTAVVMKWFAHGRLWDSAEAAEAARRAPKPPSEKRSRDWRPGGEHRDRRDAFKKGPGRRPFSAHAPHSGHAPHKPGTRNRPVARDHTQASPKRKRDMPSSPAGPAVPKPKPPEQE
jgi:hypothetical protein